MGYIGLRLGLSAELVRMAGTVAGLWAAFRYYQEAGDLLAIHSFLGTEWASVLAMAVLATGGYLLATRLLRLAERLVQVNIEKRVNQAGGLVAGLVRGCLVTSVILVACLQLPASSLQESIERSSLSGRAISRIAPAVYDTLNRFVQSIQSQGVREMPREGAG